MNERIIGEPVLTEDQQKAKERCLHASEDFSRAVGRKLEKSAGVDIAQMFLIIQMLQAQLEVILVILGDDHADFRERFWNHLADMFDKMTSQTLKELIVVAQPARKQ